MGKLIYEQLDEFIESITSDEKEHLLMKYDLACMLDCITVLKRLEGRRKRSQVA